MYFSRLCLGGSKIALGGDFVGYRGGRYSVEFFQRGLENAVGVTGGGINFVKTSQAAIDYHGDCLAVAYRRYTANSHSRCCANQVRIRSLAFPD